MERAGEPGGQLPPALVDRLAVGAMAQSIVNGGVDRVFNGAYRAVAQGGLEAAGVGAAERPPVLRSRPILSRRVDHLCPALHVPILALIHAGVVGAVGAIFIVVGVEVLLGGEVGVAQAVADVGRPHLAAKIGDCPSRSSSKRANPTSWGSRRRSGCSDR